MIPSLASIEPDPLVDLPHFLLALLILVPVGLTVSYFLISMIYSALTLPMQRQERVQLFLDLVELGLKEGRTPEHFLLEAVSTRDRLLDTPFRRLADGLRKGERLSDALKRSPELLPSQIISMLQTGERIGDVAKVLPACRRLAKDSVSQVRGAINYLPILIFVVTPVSVAIPLFITIFVLPKFREIFNGMAAGEPLPGFTTLVFSQSTWFVTLQLSVFAVIWFVLLAYLGGPQFQSAIQRLLPRLPDRIQFGLPWRRRRLQRDFSAMLAVTLDAGLPESEAVMLAADCTANAVMRKRATGAADRLKQGVPLPDALRVFDDDTGELGWRLTNALKGGREFLRALDGWHQSLDARAFRAEQTAAQIATTTLVLFNGLIIGSVVIAIFLALIAILNQTTLW